MNSRIIGVFLSVVLNDKAQEEWIKNVDPDFLTAMATVIEEPGKKKTEIFRAGILLGAIYERWRQRWPEFREYAHQKYPDELDEDLITMIEDLIEWRRARKV